MAKHTDADKDKDDKGKGAATEQASPGGAYGGWSGTRRNPVHDTEALEVAPGRSPTTIGAIAVLCWAIFIAWLWTS